MPANSLVAPAIRLVAPTQAIGPQPSPTMSHQEGDGDQLRPSLHLQGRAERARPGLAAAPGWRRTREPLTARRRSTSHNWLAAGATVPPRQAPTAFLRPDGHVGASAHSPSQLTPRATCRNVERWRVRSQNGSHPSGARIVKPLQDSQSRALAALASFGWRYAPLLTVILTGIQPAPIAGMADSEQMIPEPLLSEPSQRKWENQRQDEFEAWLRSRPQGKEQPGILKAALEDEKGHHQHGRRYDASLAIRTIPLGQGTPMEQDLFGRKDLRPPRRQIDRSN
jgi:hypothetical protein